MIPHCSAVALFLFAAACQDAGGASTGTLSSATLVGQWQYAGEGAVPEGRWSRSNVSKTYTFLSDGSYVLETLSSVEGSTIKWSARGKWDVHSDSITLVQQHLRFVGNPNDDKTVATSKIDAKLSADGKELTLHGKDGDCPGADCTRAYRKK
jgi:hypothetical protein